MANKEARLKHIRSGVKGRYPTTTKLINGESILDYGEIAVNYNKDNEFIVIRNSENETVEFITKNQVQTKIDAEKERAISAETKLNNDLIDAKTELIESINGKNVSASGETGDSALVTASANNNKVTVNSTTKLQNAVNKAETALQQSDKTALENQISAAQTASKVTIEESAGTGNVLKTYLFKQGGNEIGKINLAKDLVVESGKIVEKDGVKYLQLTIANQTEPVEIAVTDLVDVYTGSTYVEIGADNSISVKYKDLDTYLASSEASVGTAIRANIGQIATLNTNVSNLNTKIDNIKGSIDSDLSSYLKIADAENTYLSKQGAALTYSTISAVEGVKGRLDIIEDDYVKNGTLNSYLTKSDAESTYLPLTGGTITKGLGVEGNLNVIGENNTTTIYGNLRVKGNADISGYLKEGDINLANYVQKDNAIINGDLTVSQAGVVNDGTVFKVENSTGNATIKGNLTVNGDIDGYLKESDAMTLYTTTATVNGLISNATTDINNRLSTVEQNYLDTTTGGTISGNLDINGVLSIGSNINLPSVSVISGTDGSNTQGNIKFSNGTVTLQNVNGEAQKSLSVNSDGVTISGDLSVSGNIDGYLKESALDNYLDTTKGGTINGSLNVVAKDNGTALTSNGTTQIIGTFVAKSDGTALAKTLTLNDGGVAIGGDLSVSGDINLKAASSSKIGGVKIGYSENGKNYPVELDNDNKMFVNVPWTDNNTTYTVGSGLNMVGNQINHNTISGITTSQTFGPDGTLLNATSFELPKVTYDIHGHITNVEMHTCTIKDTTYTAATDKTLGLVKIGDNITNENGTISLTNTNITDALGYIPFNSVGGTITGGLDVRDNLYVRKNLIVEGVSTIPGYAKTADVLSINGGKVFGDFKVGITGVISGGGDNFIVESETGDTTIKGDLSVSGDITGKTITELNDKIDAIEGAVGGDLSSYLTKTEAESTYLSKQGAALTYSTISTVTGVSNRLSTVEGSLGDYLKESEADNKYMSKDNEFFSNMYIDADGTFEAYPDNFIIAYPQDSETPYFSIKGDTLGNGVNIESVDGVTITGDLTVNGLINGDIEFGSDNFKTNGINLNLLSQYSVLNGQDVKVIASNTAYDRTIYDIENLEHNGLISNTEHVKLESVSLNDDGNFSNIFLRVDKNGICLDSEKGIGINGDVLSTGTITAENIVNTSDLSLKDVIKEEVITVDDIANAPLFTYTLKDDVNKTKMIGTSAQYWKEVLPQVVFGEEGKYSLAYSNLAVASSISLAKEVKLLKDENEMLKNEMKELKEMINQIINK